MKKNKFDSSEIMYCSDKLLTVASNRYRITVAVAKRAKERRMEDFENDSLEEIIKPVPRAIVEMSDEIISRIQVVNQVNQRVNRSIELSQFRDESDFDAWNDLIKRITNFFAGPSYTWDLRSAEKSVKRLIDDYGYLPRREVAHILIVQKTLQTAGVNFLNSIPYAGDVISAIANYDLPHLAKIAVEMVYQIGTIYGRKKPKTIEQIVERELEILSIYSCVLLIDKAIETGIGFLKFGWSLSTAIKASVKALFIYLLGHSACIFYEQKFLSQVSRENANYLEQFTVNNTISEEKFTNYLNDDIEETLTRYVPPIIIDPTIFQITSFESGCRDLEILLRARQWEKADELTFSILLFIGDDSKEGYLNNLEVKNLPCDKLLQIDKLWTQHSNGKFGFSVQTDIYKSLGGTVKYDLDKWRKFGETLGWRKNERWLSYEKMMNLLNFESVPRGYLPARGVGGLKYVGSYRLIYTRFDQCRFLT